MDWLNAWHSICLCKFNSYVCVNFCKPSMAEPGQADALRRQNAPLSLSLHYREGQRPALPSSGGSCGQWPVMPSEASIGGGTPVVTGESLPCPTQSVIIIVGRVPTLSALSGVTLPAMTHDHVNTQHLSKCLRLTQWEMIRATKWQHTTSLGQLRKLNIALWQLNKYLSHLPWYSCLYLNTGRTDACLFMFLYSENPDA